MAPHVAFIVVGVVVGVGVAYAVGQHVYPELKPHFDELFRNFKENVNRRRRSEHPYESLSPDDIDRNRTSYDDYEPKEMEDKSFRARADFSAGSSSIQPARAEGLRQRARPASFGASNEKLFDADVEMVQLDKAESTAYPLLRPTATMSNSRGPTTTAPLEDYNPFQEPSVPVAVAIPLPQSPSASLVIERTDQTSPTVSRPQLPALSPFADSANDMSDERTPIATNAPRLPSEFESRRTTIPSPRPQIAHRPADSISGVLSPPTLPSNGTDTTRSPPTSLARASSPSVSDPMSGSFVSTTPSRNWTDGGTADIFSGSERESGYHDSDEDGVRSVSDSDEWEEVDSTRVASPPAQGANRFSRGRN